MNWQSAVSVVIDNIEYQLSLTVGTYGHNWIFTAEDITEADNSKLLLQKIYFNFDITMLIFFASALITISAFLASACLRILFSTYT